MEMTSSAVGGNPVARQFDRIASWEMPTSGVKMGQKRVAGRGRDHESHGGYRPPNQAASPRPPPAVHAEEYGEAGRTSWSIMMTSIAPWAEERELVPAHPGELRWVDQRRGRHVLAELDQAGDAARRARARLVLGVILEHLGQRDRRRDVPELAPEGLAVVLRGHDDLDHLEAGAAEPGSHLFHQPLVERRVVGETAVHAHHDQHQGAGVAVLPVAGEAGVVVAGAAV